MLGGSDGLFLWSRCKDVTSTLSQASVASAASISAANRLRVRGRGSEGVPAFALIGPLVYPVTPTGRVTDTRRAAWPQIGSAVLRAFRLRWSKGR